MFDLPAHLSNLNSIQSPPSQAINNEHEEAFWDFMHTDQLFENFGGVSPAAHDAKAEMHRGAAGGRHGGMMSAPAPTPAPTLAAYAAPSPSPAAAAPRKNERESGPTIEAFLAAFANEHASSSTGYRLPITLPLPYSSAPTPNSVDTASIIPRPQQPQPEEVYGENGERLSGTKKLKQLGAPPAEIEEDKRRRNTEASARFRQKKKERENALEIRASMFSSFLYSDLWFGEDCVDIIAEELEAQVAQLVADKSSLENENKLLKAIVLGSGQAGAEQLQGAMAAFGAKRKRDE
ncbi:regulatory protein cys-3 [Dioszegia hungarica]|uniref:Regulatory protein cys-3 n=1 Tax=Dioszegia hungarica TaxID=4972 RepID=A0AA38LV94_9TREE|nr:regulatory protein cys-3 [Dioszegia hungarica]KAI9636298.1 regulatory protein cys-3 [Dioszegia hungarica]